MILAGVVAFFAIVIGAAAYFFRAKRGSEREDVEAAHFASVRKSPVTQPGLGDGSVEDSNPN